LVLTVLLTVVVVVMDALRIVAFTEPVTGMDAFTMDALTFPETGTVAFWIVTGRLLFVMFA
jgi:hypothetical protein